MAILETASCVDEGILLCKTKYRGEGDAPLVFTDDELSSPLENQIDNGFGGGGGYLECHR